MIGSVPLFAVLCILTAVLCFAAAVMDAEHVRERRLWIAAGITAIIAGLLA